MDPNKQLDDLFQQMKEVDRSKKARQEGLVKLRARVQKKKRFHLAPAFISFGMLIVAALLFLTFTTGESPAPDSQSGVGTPNEMEERAITHVLNEEFNGPNKEFIKLKTNPANVLTGSSTSAEDSDTVFLYEFLEKTYGPYFTESGFDNFVPYAYFYHLGEESSSYQFTLGSVEIKKTNDAPSQYQIDFQVRFTNSFGVSENFPMKGIAKFGGGGKLQDIEFEDPEGLSVTILENI